jgi:GAF domain-containing protein
MRVVLLAAVAAAAALLVFRLIRRRTGHNGITSLRLAAIARASSLLDRNLDLEQALPDALRMLTPQFADWCTVHIVEDHGVRRAAIVHTNPETERKLADVLNRQPFRLDTPIGPARVIRTGEPELTRDVALDEFRSRRLRVLEIQSTVGLRSSLIVPLKAAERTLGSLTLAKGTSNAYDVDDLEWAQDLGNRIGAAIDRARSRET